MNNPGRNEELYTKVQTKVNAPIITFIGKLVLLFLALYVLIYGLVPIIGLIIPIPSNPIISTQTNPLALLLVLVGVAVVFFVAKVLQAAMGKKK